MLAFGIVTVHHGHDRYVHKEHYQLSLENLDWALDKYANYRIKGDRNEAYDFLTNPERKDEPRLYIGSTDSNGYDEEEYFITKP